MRRAKGSSGNSKCIGRQNASGDALKTFLSRFKSYPNVIFSSCKQTFGITRFVLRRSASFGPVRIGLDYRALAVEDKEDIIWVWIGSHDEDERRSLNEYQTKRKEREMDKFCYSCGAPLSLPDFKGPAENYCKYCTDGKGNLKRKEEVKQGIAQWLKMWQPDMNDEKALERASYYMKAMPAWAE